MSILHTVKTSPFQTFALMQCLSIINNDDCLLLIEDAVIASHAEHPLLPELKKLATQGRLMVLSSDLKARGLSNKIGKNSSYADFVNLVIEYKSQMAW